MDRENGLLAWAPMWFALPAAAWLARRDTWMVWIPAILLFLPSAAHDSWWAGWSPTGRLLAPLIPWIGLPLMLLLRNARSRAILAPLLLIQLFIVAYGWQHPRSFWPKGDGANAALENVPLVGSKMAAGFPSLRTSQIGFRDCVWPLTAVAVVSSLLVLSAKASRPLPPAVVETSAA